MTYSKEAYLKFNEKNHDKITKKNICNICGGKYTYYHKSNHNNTQKHLKALIKVHEQNNDHENLEIVKNKLLNKIL